MSVFGEDISQWTDERLHQEWHRLVEHDQEGKNRFGRDVRAQARREIAHEITRREMLAKTTPYEKPELSLWPERLIIGAGVALCVVVGFVLLWVLLHFEHPQ
jgi:hypothetical protein